MGIWAFGPTAAARVDHEPVAERTHRAVAGLDEMIDGYEFHYPNEISAENLDEVQAALGRHDIYCIVSGLHLDHRFCRGGLVNPRASLRAEARRIVSETAVFAGRIGADVIIWLGIEGYNNPFEAPYASAWRWLIEGVAEAADICARHRVKLFLDHRNPEPAAQILKRNIGMCLHVIQELRKQGIHNVKMSMDWQHLLMNGERLSEYAALFASEGLLGHQHANSGWGIFDDDDMVGKTAFVETLELALELRRCRYGAGGERLGFDLYADNLEDQIASVKRSVLEWRYIDSVAAKVDAAALRQARRRKDAGQVYEIVQAALGG